MSLSTGFLSLIVLAPNATLGANTIKLKNYLLNNNLIIKLTYK